MKSLVVAGLLIASFTLAGCTGGDGLPSPVIKAARVDEKDVPRDGHGFDHVDCGTTTKLTVVYKAGPPDDEEPGKFSVQVFSQSSRFPYDEEGNGGIGVWPTNDDEGRFAGTESGTFTAEINGTPGTWLLKAHRTTFHNGQFTAALQCVEESE